MKKFVQFRQNFCPEIHNASAMFAPQMMMRSDFPVKPFLSAGKFQFADHAPLSHVFQIPVNGAQADLRHFMTQYALKFIGSGMRFHFPQFADNCFTLDRFIHLPPPENKKIEIGFFSFVFPRRKKYHISAACQIRKENNNDYPFPFYTFLNFTRIHAIFLCFLKGK